MLTDQQLMGICRRQLSAGGHHPGDAEDYAGELHDIFGIDNIDGQRLVDAWREVSADRAARNARGRPSVAELAAKYRANGTASSDFRQGLHCARNCRSGELVCVDRDGYESVVPCDCSGGDRRRAEMIGCHRTTPTPSQLEASGFRLYGRPPPMAPEEIAQLRERIAAANKRLTGRW